MSLGGSASLKIDKRSFSLPRAYFIETIFLYILLKSSITDLEGITIFSLLRTAFKSRFLIPVVPFS